MKTNAPQRDNPRAVQFTRAAAEQVRELNLNLEHRKTLFRRLRDVSALERVTDDKWVCAIEQTRREWYRLKLANLDPSVRVAFSLEDGDDTLLVRMVAARSDATYDAVQTLYELATAV